MSKRDFYTSYNDFSNKAGAFFSDFGDSVEKTYNFFKGKWDKFKSNFDDPFGIKELDQLNYDRQMDIAFQQQEAAQASARESMAFNAEQSRLNREFQQASAREAMRFESAEAAAQRQWLTDMNNTGYQRMVADLREAGLNPILAAGAQPSSVSAGAIGGGFSASGSAATGNSAQMASSNYNPNSTLSFISSIVGSIANVAKSVATRKLK